MSLPATDSFTGANGTALTTYSANWAITSGNFVINTNSIAPNNSGECGARWVADAFNNDQYAQLVIAAMSGTAEIGVAVRANATSYYGFYVVNGLRELHKNIAGAFTSLASDGVTAIVGDVLRIEANGTTIRALVNGVQIFSVTDTSLASGAAGLSGSGTTTTTRGDSWEGGNLGSAPSGLPRSALIVTPASFAHLEV